MKQKIGNVAIAVLMIAAIAFALMSIWLWDIRWILTGMIAALAAIGVAIATDDRPPPDGYVGM